MCPNHCTEIDFQEDICKDGHLQDSKTDEIETEKLTQCRMAPDDEKHAFFFLTKASRISYEDDELK